MNKKWIIALIFGFLLIAGLGYFFSPSSKGEKSYLKEKVQRGQIQVTILATGTVQPQNRLEIKPPVPGRVDQILVEEGQKVKKGQILAWMSSTERAAMIDAARAQGAEEVKRWEEIYKPTPIIAPLSGTIISRKVESGQTFTSTESVLVMSDRLTIKAQVDETDLAKIRENQKCEIRLDSYPDQPIEGKVVHIAYEAKTISNVTTYIIDVLPEEAPENMRAGMTANVTFFVETKKDVLLVPTGFIKYEKGKPNILVEGSDQKTTLREISLGSSDGKRTEITSGLNEGDVVVLEIIKKTAQGSNPFSPIGNRPAGSSQGPQQGQRSSGNPGPPGPPSH